MRLEFVCAPGCRPPVGTRAALHALGARLAPGRLVVHVVVARDPLLRRLNRDYRGRDRTTDVLSFRYDGEAGRDRRSRGAEAPGSPDAEVYVSLDRVAVQAREHGHTPAREFVRLAVHGLLHVQGHDHHTATEARRMRAAETRALRWLGIRWPRVATSALVAAPRPTSGNAGR